MDHLLETLGYILQKVLEHRTFLLATMIFSIIAFFATLASVPFLLIHLPADYFSDKRQRKKAPDSSIKRLAWLIVKNILGWIVILAGIAMLVLPGQGILTIVAGLMLVNFPGKYRFERRLISRPQVLNGVNRLREKAGKPPLILD